MREAISAYRQITVTPEFQEAERLRSKARHDEAQALWNERRKEKLDIAKKMLADGESVEKTARYTGLAHEEIEGLQVTV